MKQTEEGKSDALGSQYVCEKGWSGCKMRLEVEIFRLGFCDSD